MKTINPLSVKIFVCAFILILGSLFFWCAQNEKDKKTWQYFGETAEAAAGPDKAP